MNPWDSLKTLTNISSMAKGENMTALPTPVWTVNSTEASDMKPAFDPPGPFEVTIEILLLILVCVSGTFMNIVILLIIGRKQEKSPVSMLIFNLAITDLIQCMLVVPSNIYGLLIHTWPLGRLGCLVQHALLSIPYVVSFWLHLGLSTHRLAMAMIKHRLCRYLTSHYTVNTYIMIVWLVQVLVHVFLLYVENAKIDIVFTPSYGICMIVLGSDADAQMTLGIALTVHVWVPFFGCLISYICIHRIVQKQVNLFPTETARRRYNRMSRYTGILFIIFTVCWLPDYLRTLIDNTNESPVWVIRLFNLAVYANCAVNPYIYAFRCEPIKTAFLNSFPLLRPIFNHQVAPNAHHHPPNAGAAAALATAPTAVNAATPAATPAATAMHAATPAATLPATPAATPAETAMNAATAVSADCVVATPATVSLLIPRPAYVQGGGPPLPH